MSSPEWDAFPPAFRKTLTEQDIRENSTLQSFERLSGHLDQLQTRQTAIDTILDVGCNRGGFAAALGKHLDAETVYGIDTDPECREHARERGLEPFDVDVETDPFPVEQGTVDVVLCFGLVEHLVYYDNLLSEINRVLDDGLFWITTPNLGSWLNRFALLTGHQPRNVEVSRERAVGTLPVYDKGSFLNYVHAPTYKGLLELLAHYGFSPVETAAMAPCQRSRVDALLDRLFSLRTAWGRRVSVLARQGVGRDR